MGWAVTRWKPAFMSTGRWVWFLPSVVVVPDLLYELLRRQQVLWLPESLFATGSNEGLAVYLLTLPTCSAIGYSIGAYFKGRTTLHGGGSTAKAIAVFISVLALLTLLAHNVESGRIAKWKSLRFVIDPEGLNFSAEAIHRATQNAPSLDPCRNDRTTNLRRWSDL